MLTRVTRERDVYYVIAPFIYGWYGLAFGFAQPDVAGKQPVYALQPSLWVPPDACSTAVLVVTTKLLSIHNVEWLISQWSRVILRRPQELSIELPDHCWIECPDAASGGTYAQIVIPAPLRKIPELPVCNGKRRWIWQGSLWDDAELIVQHRHWIRFVGFLLRRMPPEIVREMLSYVNVNMR